MQFLHPFDGFQNYKWLLRQSKLEEKSFWWKEKKYCRNWCRTSRKNHKQQIQHYIKQRNHLHYICCVKSTRRILHSAIGWQVNKLLGAIVNKGIIFLVHSFSPLGSLQTWKSFWNRNNIINLGWCGCTKLFWKCQALWPLMDWTKMH
jgi:hypothetical protein